MVGWEERLLVESDVCIGLHGMHGSAANGLLRPVTPSPLESTVACVDGLETLSPMWYFGVARRLARSLDARGRGLLYRSLRLDRQKEGEGKEGALFRKRSRQ